MERIKYIRQLLANGHLKAAIEQLNQALEDTRLADSSLMLLARYNRLQKEINDGVVARPDHVVSTNQLLNAVTSLTKDLGSDYPNKAKQIVEASEPAPDPITSIKQESGNQAGPSYHFHAPVGSVNPNNQGHIVQHIDQSQNQSNIEIQIVQQLPQIRSMVQASKDAGIFDEDACSEIIEILDDVEENPVPKNEKQSKKWKRWLGKATEAASKILQGRLEKGADTVVSEGVKKWLGDGGLELLSNFVEQLA
ncbi:MAG: hypothetical protein AAF927_20925 [Bacteroidota bacterium]